MLLCLVDIIPPGSSMVIPHRSSDLMWKSGWCPVGDALDFSSISKTVLSFWCTQASNGEGQAPHLYVFVFGFGKSSVFGSPVSRRSLPNTDLMHFSWCMVREFRLCSYLLCLHVALLRETSYIWPFIYFYKLQIYSTFLLPQRDQWDRKVRRS